MDFQRHENPEAGSILWHGPAFFVFCAVWPEGASIAGFIPAFA